MNKARTNGAASALALVVLATLMAPLAASAGDATGRLSVSGSPSFFGPWRVASSNAAAFLDGEGPAGMGELAGTAASVSARHVVLYQNGTSAPAGLPVGIGAVNPAYDARVHYANVSEARVAFAPRGAHEVVAAVEPAQAGTISFASDGGEIRELGHLARDLEYRRGVPAHDLGFAQRVAHGSMAFLRQDANLTDTFGTGGAPPRLELRDGVRLYVMGGPVHLRSADGSVTWETGLSERSVVSGAGLLVERTVAFAVLELRGARLNATLGDGAFRFFAAEAVVHVVGEMAFASADGRLDDGTGMRRLASDSGVVDGDFAARLRLRHGADLPMATHRYPVSMDQEAIVTSAELEGSFRLASLNGRALAPAAGLRVNAANLAAGAGIGLGLVALGWGLQKAFVALGGFARPAPTHPALANALRNRLETLVRRYPGIHGRRLQQLVGVTSGTFVHHMRVLVESNLVSRRRIGSTVVYVPASRAGVGRALPAVELRVRSALTTDVRRRIAAALAAGAKTQRELSQAVGVPQQNVSFHLKALLERGAVTVAPSRPHVYQLRDEFAGAVRELAAPGP